jgi:hypothetical protein
MRLAREGLGNVQAVELLLYGCKNSFVNAFYPICLATVRESSRARE